MLKDAKKVRRCHSMQYLLSRISAYREGKGAVKKREQGGRMESDHEEEVIIEVM